MAIQKRNDEQVALLAADFQQRYESGFSWRTACATYQALTGLRGFWPMSAISSAGNAFDQSGNVRTLTYNGNPTYDFDGLAPYIRLDGTGDYLARTDEAGLDILGTETFLAAGHRGLTLGGWFRPEDDTNTQMIMSKWGAAGGGQFSYVLELRGADAGDPVRFGISDDGTNSDSVDSTTGYSTNTWHFCAGRYNDADTGAELAVWNNEEMTTAATARAAIFNSNADFRIGARGDGTLLYTGRASLCFLCAAALADATVWAIYQQTRALFKV
jgi:hypothetical protein